MLNGGNNVIQVNQFPPLYRSLPAGTHFDAGKVYHINLNIRDDRTIDVSGWSGPQEITLQRDGFTTLTGSETSRSTALKKITVTGTGNIYLLRVNAPSLELVIHNGITVTIDGNCTLKKITFVGNGTLTLKNSDDPEVGNLQDATDFPTNISNLTLNEGLIGENENSNLKIQNAYLIANGPFSSAAIGSGGFNTRCGNITIDHSFVKATGGVNAAGIGSGYNNTRCGNITIDNSFVKATGGENAAAIGSGGFSTRCGNITIHNAYIQASGNSEPGAPGGPGIGSGYDATCGDINISGGKIHAQGGVSAPGIGTGISDSSCGNIDISGGAVVANGGSLAAAIGVGAPRNNHCGTITLRGSSTVINATKGVGARDDVGLSRNAENNSCGLVTYKEGVTVNGTKYDTTHTYQP